MATLTLEASYWRIMLPRLVQGFGIGFTFVSTVALGAVPMRELGHASGLFNFTRTIAGSIGIAAMSTLLARGSQVHQVRLAAHMSPYDPDVWERVQTLTAMFVARGADPVTAEQQAWAQLYAVVRREAMSLSFIDNFWRLAWIFVAVIPFVLFLGRRAPRPEAPGEVEKHGAVVEA